MRVYSATEMIQIKLELELIQAHVAENKAIAALQVEAGAVSCRRCMWVGHKDSTRNNEGGVLLVLGGVCARLRVIYAHS
jgi:hypothetical protein